LRRQLARSFGDLPDWVEQRLARAGTEALETWAERCWRRPRWRRSSLLSRRIEFLRGPTQDRVGSPLADKPGHLSRHALRVLHN
jgi:hypothetical protein